MSSALPFFQKIVSRIRKDLSQAGLALAILAVYGIVTQMVFHTVCPFAILTGYPCPGCGLTHAGLALLCGRFAQAAQWNPSIFLWAPYLLYLILFRYVLGKKIPAALPLAIAVCLATLLCFVWRIQAGVPIAVPCKGLLRGLIPTCAVPLSVV